MSEYLKRYELTGATLGQLAQVYKVDLRTFKKWIKPLGTIKTDDSRILTPAQVKQIVNHVDRP